MYHYPDPQWNTEHFEFDRIFKSVLHRDESHRLLEVGAGGSIWLPYFAREFGYEVYGIDYSEKGCKIAEKNLALSGVKGRIVCKDLFHIRDQWKGFFDVIISFGGVEHFNNPPEVIQLMKKCLRADGPGLIITCAPNTAGLLFLVQKYIDRKIYNMHKVLSLDDLSECHRKAGMQIIMKRYIGFMDLFVINYQRKFRGGFQKWVWRGITKAILPLLYVQKLLRLSPQNGKLCAYMVVIAQDR